MPSGNFEPKLVIMGYLNNQETIHVKVSANSRPDEVTNIIPIEDAKIILWEDGNEIGTLKHDSMGIYSINHYPRYNHRYSIRVEHPDYPTAEAETYITEPISFTGYKKVIDSIENNKTTFYIKIGKRQEYGYLGIALARKYKVFCSDRDYSYILYRCTKSENGFEFFMYGRYPTNFYNPSLKLITRGDDSFFAGDIMCLSEKNFIQPEYPVTTQDYYNYINTVIIYDFSFDTYQFYKSIAIYEYQTESSLTAPFLTPTAIHSNIKNGLGVFGYIFTYDFQIDSISGHCYERP